MSCLAEMSAVPTLIYLPRYAASLQVNVHIVQLNVNFRVSFDCISSRIKVNEVIHSQNIWDCGWDLPNSWDDRSPGNVQAGLWFMEVQRVGGRYSALEGERCSKRDAGEGRVIVCWRERWPTEIAEFRCSRCDGWAGGLVVPATWRQWRRRL